jgi:Rha family phage regulatory protein
MSFDLDKIELETYNGKVYCDTLLIGKFFNKQVKDINRKINNFIIHFKEAYFYANLKVNIEDYFVETSYIDVNKKPQRKFLLTKDGFNLVVLGFTGREALIYKIRFIQRFNEMENSLKNLINERNYEFDNIYNVMDSINSRLEKIENKIEPKSLIDNYKPLVVLLKELGYNIEKTKLGSISKKLIKLCDENSVDYRKERRLDDKYETYYYDSSNEKLKELIKSIIEPIN